MALCGSVWLCVWLCVWLLNHDADLGICVCMCVCLSVWPAFELFDLDGDGVITQQEMATYLTSVYKIMFEATPGLGEQLGMTPAELAGVCMGAVCVCVLCAVCSVNWDSGRESEYCRLTHSTLPSPYRSQHVMHSTTLT